MPKQDGFYKIPISNTPNALGYIAADHGAYCYKIAAFYSSDFAGAVANSNYSDKTKHYISYDIYLYYRLWGLTRLPMGGPRSGMLLNNCPRSEFMAARSIKIITS